jgi:hypothetical protein
MGLGPKVHREQLETGLPADLYEEFHRLAEWAGTLGDKFGRRVALRVVDVASLEGFVKSLMRRFRTYPAFTVDGRRYVGLDFSRVDALIAESLAFRTSRKEDTRG